MVLFVTTQIKRREKNDYLILVFGFVNIFPFLQTDFCLPSKAYIVVLKCNTTVVTNSD